MRTRRKVVRNTKASQHKLLASVLFDGRRGFVVASCEGDYLVLIGDPLEYVIRSRTAQEALVVAKGLIETEAALGHNVETDLVALQAAASNERSKLKLRLPQI